MTSEEAPLLAPEPNQHELVYQRFSPFYKKIIVFMISWCSVMPFFISGSFYPSIPQIARDLNTTGQNVSLAVSMSVFSTSIGALLAASYSTFYGRRRIYLISLPISVIGSLGVSSAQNMPQLLFWRIWQCAGASPGLSVGAAVIGDIFKLEERGTAMGFFLLGTNLGPALAPPVGGFVAYYASWRVMQLGLGVMSFLAFIMILLALPETSHPGKRGIDQLRLTGEVKHSWRYVNPLRPLHLIRSPNMVGVSTAGGLQLLTDFVLLIPLSYTIGKRYHLHNEALVGACFIPSGLGNMVGAVTSGRLADKVIIHYKKKRGTWYPEDRLRATFLGSLVFVPLSVLGCGLVTHYIGGYFGLTLNLILIFFNGVGVTMSVGPAAAYVVDVIHSRSAEAMAFNAGFRNFLLAFATAGVMPMINTYGMVVTNTLAAVLSWFGFLLLALIVRYGDEMRAWSDVGYSTAENN